MMHETTSIRPFARLLFALLGALLAAALVAGCGGDDDSDGDDSTTTEAETTAPGDTSDTADTAAEDTTGETTGDDGSAEIAACDLLTAEEVGGVFGGVAPEGVPDDAAGMIYSCTWQSDDVLSILQVSVTAYDNADDAAGMVESTIETNGYPEITGIGDRAYDSSPFFDISVLQGRFEVDVSVSIADDETDAANARDLAANILERLPA